MSATLKNIYGAIPATTRGKSIHVGGDPKGNNWLYTTGSAVFIRNLKEPLKSEMYTEHSHQTTVARYAPSGFYIASGDITGTVRIWDTTQKEHILKIELKVIGGPILDLQWSDDSKRIVAVGEGRDKFGSVFLFDSGSSVGEITGHTKPITTCDFKQVRPYRVATGSEDFSVAWLEGPPFKFKKALKEQTRFVNCVRFSPDGNYLVSVGSDKTGHIYDGKTGDYIKAFSTASAHTAGIYSASWSPDSKQILTASADKTCKIWDAASGDCVKTFTFGANPPVELQMLGCLWQGDTLISIALSGEVYYLDVNNPEQPLRVLRGHNKFITALAFDKENNKMYSASYDSSIIQWDVQTGATENFTGKGHGNQVNSLAVQGGNLVSVGMDDSIRLTPTLPRAYKDDAVKVENNPVAVTVGKKDTSLVFAVATDAILVLKNGKLVNKFAVKYQPGSIAISVDETQLSVGGKDNALYQYSISGTDLKETKVLKNHRGPVTALSYSKDGQYLASADANREIFVWTKSGELKVQGWVFHSAKINSLDWSPDSLHLVSGGLDGNLYVWSIEKTDKRIFVKDAHRGGVNAVLFLDDNTIASAGQDCAIKSWTLAYH